MKYRITESRLRSMIRETVEHVINEMQQGGSSAPGATYNWNGDKPCISSNQGGYFGYDKGTESDDERRWYKNKEAKRKQEDEAFYRSWCYNNYEDCKNVAGAEMNRGDYRAAYEKMKRNGW